MTSTKSDNSSSSWAVRTVIALVIVASFVFVYLELDKNQVAFGDVITSAKGEFWLGGALIVALMMLWPFIWMVTR